MDERNAHWQVAINHSVERARKIADVAGDIQRVANDAEREFGNYENQNFGESIADDEIIRRAEALMDDVAREANQIIYDLQRALGDVDKFRSLLRRHT